MNIRLSLSDCFRLSQRRCSVKKGALKDFAKHLGKPPMENTCSRVSFLIKLQPDARNFIKKETLEQAFPCEFSEIFQNSYFVKHLRMTASGRLSNCHNLISFLKSHIELHFFVSLVVITRALYPKILLTLLNNRRF